MSPTESQRQRVLLVSVIAAGIVMLCHDLKSTIDWGLSDDELVADATCLVQETFSHLPDDHPVIKRHGHFVLMPPAPETFYRNDPINVGVTPIPGCLTFDLNGQFEKHVVPVEIGVTKDQSRRVQVLEILPPLDGDFDPADPFEIRVSVGNPAYR